MARSRALLRHTHAPLPGYELRRVELRNPRYPAFFTPPRSAASEQVTYEDHINYETYVLPDGKFSLDVLAYWGNTILRGRYSPMCRVAADVRS